MSTVPTQIRIDNQLKDQASTIFAHLGLDMSSAVNIFLRQCVLRGGLPFSVDIPNYNEKVLAAMGEAKQLASDDSKKGYIDSEKLRKALESE